MTRKGFCLPFVYLLLLFSLAACSGQQVYGVGQAWQRNECFKIIDSQERSRCLEKANTPYYQYNSESKDTE
jgi:hypothetical protein